MDPSISFGQAEMNLQSSTLSRLEKLARATPQQAEKAAEEFEGFFVAMVLENMFAGIDTNSMFGGGQGEKVFRSLLLQEYGKTIAQRGDLGLADTVKREILKLQEVEKQ